MAEGGGSRLVHVATSLASLWVEVCRRVYKIWAFRVSDLGFRIP